MRQAAPSAGPGPPARNHIRLRIAKERLWIAPLIRVYCMEPRSFGSSRRNELKRTIPARRDLPGTLGNASFVFGRSTEGNEGDGEGSRDTGQDRKVERDRVDLNGGIVNLGRDTCSPFA